jgi:hypothetical protein
VPAPSNAYFDAQNVRPVYKKNNRARHARTQSVHESHRRRRARPASLRNPRARVTRIQTNRPPARATSIATPRHRHGTVPETQSHRIAPRVIARTHLVDVHVVVIVFFAPIDRWSLTLVLVFIGRGGVAVGARAAFHGCVATRVRVLCAVRANACASGRDAKCGHGVNASQPWLRFFLNCFGTETAWRGLNSRGVPALMRDVWLKVRRDNYLHGAAIGFIRGEALGDAPLLTGFDDEL